MRILLWGLFAIGLWTCQETAGPTGPADEVVVEEELPATDWSAFVGRDYLIDDQHSYIGFKIKYFGFSPVRGRFNAFDGKAFYDPADLRNLRVVVFVDAASINTGNERRDEDLKKEGTWFNVPAYPYLSFISSAVLPHADGSFDLIGDLTIRDVTRTDTIHFDAPTPLSKDWAANDQVDFSGRVVIDRQDYGVYGGDFWSSVMENGLTQLSDAVEIEIDMHCRRADYPARYADAEPGDLDKIVLDTIRAGGLERGIRLIDELAARDEISAGKLSTIGYTLLAWNQPVEATRVFQRRQALFPDNPATWSQLGIAALRQEDVPSAERYFNEAVQRDSADSRAHLYLSILPEL